MVDVTTWSETPASNTTVDGVSIAEFCSPANINNAIRSVMAGVKTYTVTVTATYAPLSGATLTSPTINGGTIAAATLTTPTITSPVVTELVLAITDAAAFEINPANGSIQTINLGASRTPKGTSFANGQSITMAINDGTASTITWTDATFGGSGVIWLGGAAPPLATTGWTWVALWKMSGQVYGSLLGTSA